MARVGDYITESGEEVWPRELEAHFSIDNRRRQRIIAMLAERQRIVVLGGGPNVRYKVRHGSNDLTGFGTTSRTNLRDPAKARDDEAKAEAASTEAAMEKLPLVREWVAGASNFGARQLRDVFDLTPGGATRVLAALTKEGLVTRDGATYKGTQSNGGGETLEQRAIGAMSASGGMSLTGLAERLHISEEVARNLLNKLYREGEIRPRRKGGALQYEPV